MFKGLGSPCERKKLSDKSSADQKASSGENIGTGLRFSAGTPRIMKSMRVVPAHFE
jgi:hypothetical protein